MSEKEVPLNVLIQLQGTAAAYVRAAETKQAYDALVPPVPEVEGLPPAPKSLIPLAPIPTGRRIETDPSKYVTDREATRRIR